MPNKCIIITFSVRMKMGCLSLMLLAVKCYLYNAMVMGAYDTQMPDRKMPSQILCKIMSSE